MGRLLPPALLLTALSFAAEEAPPSPENLQREARLLGNDEAQTRADAERRLLRTGLRFPEAVLAALKALPKDDLETEASAQRISLRISNPRWRAGLELAGDDAEMRDLVDALFQDPSGDAIRGFAQRAKGASAERAAFVIAGLLQNPRAAPLPHPLASCIPLPVRAAAAQALGELKATAHAGEVAQLLEDAGPVVRRTAVWALGEMGAREAEPRIALRLRDESPDVRHDAAIVLGSMLKARSSAGEIAKLLDDSERPVREAAAGSLLQLAGERWANGPGLVEQARRCWESHRNDPAFAPE